MKQKRNILINWLLWVTNNEDKPKHEIEFDMAFFLINTIAIIVGAVWLIKTNTTEWLAFLIIEYTWALDNMRHNRQ
jgi:hypothetical membrane protein